MCGIGGILRVWTPDQRELALRTPHAQSIPEAWLDILDDAVKHRGPDGQGRFRDRAIRADGCVVDVAFIHRRLSIIDHAGGHQPMVLQLPKRALSASSGSESGGRPMPGKLLSTEELAAHNRFILAEAGVGTDANPELALRALSSQDRIAVVFNGCIYNHRELRAELQSAGHVFSTDHSDTEVLVHGWRQWGLGELIQREHIPLRSQGLCGRLKDMFAFAVWNSTTATLTLARDRFGQKPLYLAAAPEHGAWAFSSSVTGLLKVLRELRQSAELHDGLLHAWIRFGSAAEPPVKGVSCIAHSTTLSLPAKEIEPEWYESPEFFGRFWVSPFGDVGFGGRSRTLTADDVEQGLRNAINARLESDVPLGCFLSGGVDSSLITAFAAQTIPELRTFSVRMPTPAMDESSFAERVASQIGTRHRTLDCEAAPSQDLLSAIHEIGLPFGDSSLLPTLWVSRATRQEVKVALSGDGGDELFGGYDRYRGAAILSRWKLLLALVPAASDADARSNRTRMARLADAARHDGYLDLVSIFPLSMIRALVPTLTSGTFRTNPYTRPVGTENAIDHDLDTYLPDDLLRKTDSASMAFALEVRCPFLAPDVAGPASSATIASLMPRGRQGGRKGLLRQVARKYLPAEIVDRPKMGFAIPIGEWFRSDYGGLRTMLLDHLNSTEPFGPPSLGIDLNMAFIRQMLDEHLGTGPSGQIKRDHSQRLYMLLVLSIWAKWLGSLR